MADVAALQKLIEPEVEAEGLALVRVKMTGGTSDPTLQVMAERPDTRQLNLQDCERLSRRLSDRLDEADPIEEGYRLEVSSPGIDRPLTRPQDFANWAGHDVNISLNEPVSDHRKLRGELLGVEDSLVQVEDRKHGRFAIPLAQIKTAKLVLTDKLIAATRPLDMSGAEQIEEFTEEEEKVQD